MPLNRRIPFLHCNLQTIDFTKYNSSKIHLIVRQLSFMVKMGLGLCLFT